MACRSVRASKSVSLRESKSASLICFYWSVGSPVNRLALGHGLPRFRMLGDS